MDRHEVLKRGWPTIDEKLLEYLQALFPERCMLPNETERDHLRYAGAVGLIELLAVTLDGQVERKASQHDNTVIELDPETD